MEKKKYCGKKKIQQIHPKFHRNNNVEVIRKMFLQFHAFHKPSIYSFINNEIVFEYGLQEPVLHSNQDTMSVSLLCNQPLDHVSILEFAKS